MIIQEVEQAFAGQSLPQDQVMPNVAKIISDFHNSHKTSEDIGTICMKIVYAANALFDYRTPAGSELLPLKLPS
jgi:hypothetical protein